MQQLFFTMETIANYLESCQSIVQAVVCRTRTCWLHALGRDARSRKQSKSTLVHSTVAAGLSKKHHPTIHVGAGPIQLFYGLHSGLAAKFTHDNILFLPSFPWAFSDNLWCKSACVPQR